VNVDSVTGLTKRTSYLELFFDLVFVFAITQVAGALHSDHTAGGWARAAILLWLVWWAWSQFTWAGNAIDLEHPGVRVAMLCVTAAVLVAAIAIPGSFDDRGAWFSVPYAAVRLGGLALYWNGLRRDPVHLAALRTFVPVASIGPLVVLAGAFVSETARPWVWLAVVALDVASALAAGRGEFRVAPAHFAERHALFVIIALGESVIAVGATAADLEPSTRLVTVTLLAFGVIATLWWSYFGWVHAAAEARLAGEPDHGVRSSLARDLFSFAHFPIVAGTVVFAVGIEEAVVHPELHLETFGRTAVAAGLVLFLVGFVAGNARAVRTVLVERVVAAIAVVGLVGLIGPRVSALSLLAVLVVLMTATTVVESVRRRSR
jgi:low temperature requirement protein LtrA